MTVTAVIENQHPDLGKRVFQAHRRSAGYRPLRMSITMGRGVGRRMDRGMDGKMPGGRFAPATTRRARLMARRNLQSRAPLPDRRTDEQHRDGEHAEPSAYCPAPCLQAQLLSQPEAIR